MKPVVKKEQQANVDHITGDKIPRSFVFARSKLPGPLRQLQLDLRKLMLPFTALKLRVFIMSFLFLSPLRRFLCEYIVIVILSVSLDA